MKKLLVGLSLFTVLSVNAQTNSLQLARDQVEKALIAGDADGAVKFSQAMVTIQSAELLSVYTELLEVFKPQIATAGPVLKAFLISDIAKERDPVAEVITAWITATNVPMAKKALERLPAAITQRNKELAEKEKKREEERVQETNNLRPLPPSFLREDKQ